MSGRARRISRLQYLAMDRIRALALRKRITEVELDRRAGFPARTASMCRTGRDSLGLWRLEVYATLLGVPAHTLIQEDPDGSQQSVHHPDPEPG